VLAEDDHRAGRALHQPGCDGADRDRPLAVAMAMQLLGPDDDHGAVSVSGDLICRGREQRRGQPSLAMTADDEKFGIVAQFDQKLPCRLLPQDGADPGLNKPCRSPWQQLPS
jgi:hypothetical protein